MKELPFKLTGEGLTWVFALYNYRQNSITLQIYTLLSHRKLPNLSDIEFD